MVSTALRRTSPFQKRMEDCSSSISAFCMQLRRYCAHLDASCATLRSAVDRRPSSLPSPNLPSLLTSLIDRVSSTSQAVETLGAMTTDTISFQELLGHCMEIYKQNETSISTLEDRLKEYGYTPGEFVYGDSDDPITAYAVPDLSFGAAAPKPSDHSGEGMIAALTEAQKSLSLTSFVGGENGQFPANLYTGAGKDTGQYGSLYPGTLSLQDLGLSAAGLACLAEEESSPGIEYSTHSVTFSPKAASQNALWDVLPVNTTVVAAGGDGGEKFEPAIVDYDVPLLKPVDEDEYSSSPTWLKMQISLEDLNDFVEDICNILAKKANGKHTQNGGCGDYTLDQEDLSSLSAGTKMKPCLLLLVRLGRLRTGHKNGTTVYHVVHC